MLIARARLLVALFKRSVLAFSYIFLHTLFRDVNKICLPRQHRRLKDILRTSLRPKNVVPQNVPWRSCQLSGSDHIVERRLMCVDFFVGHFYLACSSFNNIKL